MSDLVYKIPAYSAVRPNIHWGASVWSFLHTMALWIDRRQVTVAVDATALAGLVTMSMPCVDCRAEWQACLAALPPPDAATSDLFPWTVEVHNLVNARLGRASLTLEEALARWGTV
jgi:FAD-linked sulfhydryl oxidase